MAVIQAREEHQEFLSEYDDFCTNNFRLSADIIWFTSILADVMPDKIMDGLKEVFMRRDLHKGIKKPDTIKSQMDLLYERFGAVAIEDVTPLQWQVFFKMLGENNANLLKSIIMGWDELLNDKN